MDEYLTLASLVELGFERRGRVYGAIAVGYRFCNLDMTASGVTNMYFRPEVLLTGVLNTGRTMGLVELHIPPDLETPREAAAWTSYALKPYRSDLEPLPPWFLEGERHWHLVPLAREEMAVQERLQSYRNCPKCFLDREYARPFRRMLQAALSGVCGDAEAMLSFEGRVLSIALHGSVHEVIASGESWSSNYLVKLSAGSALPARFRNPTVTVAVFEGNLSFDGRLLGPCETIE